MKIILNGEKKEIEVETIDALIKQLNVEEKVMAAAVNMNVVKKEQWGEFKLQENDKVEFLQFVGGG